MPLDLPLMFALASACAPAVAPETLIAVDRVESGFDPLAIGVGGPRPTQIHSASKAEAVATATRLIARGANVDLGLGQINARNLGPLGLTISDAFDPCRNLAASGQVLAADYDRAGPRAGAEQAALRTTLSFYNTGDATRGVRNGYVAKVMAAAGGRVPPLAPGTTEASEVTKPPAWDVFARAAAPSTEFVFSPTNFGDRP